MNKNKTSIRVIPANDYIKFKKIIQKRMKKGMIFIYPTDTIYGIGCDATNYKAVERVRKAKQSDRRPYFVIAPSKKWISKNCIIDKKAKKWINMLPGPYTLILKLKNNKCVARNITGNKTLGIRIPDNWAASIAKDMKKPIVTTSANLQGESYMTKLQDLNEKLISRIDLVIYEGEKRGRPSTIVNLTRDKPAIIKR